ncbi:MAG: EamA family transporter [Clostridia bacterium]|nr:EamA family transporter [Clostridia bacterium]
MLLLLPTGLLLAVSFVFNVATAVVQKFYNRTAPAGRESNWFYNTCMSVACLVFILIFSIDPSAADPFGTITDFSFVSAGLGILFGILVLAQSYTYMWALEVGPFSYTSVIVSLASLISALSGIFFGENIDIYQYFGMGIMVLCIVFSTDKNNGGRKSSLKWLLIALTSCITNGFVGVMQKIHQSTEYQAQSTAFLVSAFAFMTVASALIWLYERKKAGTERFEPNKKQTLFALISGATFAVPHVANLYLAGALPSAVFFPIINTGGLILTLFAATLLFKEKLTRLQWLGIALGLISSLFVSGTVSAWIG